MVAASEFLGELWQGVHSRLDFPLAYERLWRIFEEEAQPPPRLLRAVAKARERLPAVEQAKQAYQRFPVGCLTARKLADELFDLHELYRGQGRLRDSALSYLREILWLEAYRLLLDLGHVVHILERTLSTDPQHIDSVLDRRFGKYLRQRGAETEWFFSRERYEAEIAAQADQQSVGEEAEDDS